MTEASSTPRQVPDTSDGRPDFLVRLGVLLPCNEEDVKAAYRAKVMTAHPDRGGSVEEFRQVEEDYQSALHFAQIQVGRRHWLGAHVERYAAQEDLIAEIRKHGGEVELRSIDWLRSEVGEDFAHVFDTIYGVRFTGSNVTVRDVHFLCSQHTLLSGIKKLDLSGADIGNSSVALLHRLESISDLDLSGTFVSNSAAPLLAQMPMLRHVDLGQTFFGWWGRWRLRARRPDILVSSTAGRGSVRRRRFMRAAIAVAIYVGLCFVATHAPVPDVPVPQFELIPFDKVVHFSMYSLMAFLMSLVLSMRTLYVEQTASRTWFHSLLVLAGAAAYGIFDETTQPAFGRTFDWLDWAADLTGATCGIVAFLLMRRLFRYWWPVPEPLPTVVYMADG
jgi:VanZ family protein